MSDVFISFAADDAGAAQRLAGALTRVGLDVCVDPRTAPLGDGALSISDSFTQAKAVVVLWSSASVSLAVVRAQALDALDQAPAGVMRQGGKYVGVRIDGVAATDLPAPFNGLDSAAMQSWFAFGAGEDFSHAGFRQVLTALEALSCGADLCATAAALAPPAPEAPEIAPDPSAEQLAAAHAALATAEDRARELAQEVAALKAARDRLVAEHAQALDIVDRQHRDLAQSHAELTARAAHLAADLQAVQSDRDALNKSHHALKLDKAELARQLQDQRQHAAALDDRVRQIDARLTETAASLARRDAELQAGDQTIRALLEERTALATANTGLMQDVLKAHKAAERLTADLAQRDTRLATFERALMDRMAERAEFERKVAAQDSELGRIGPRLGELENVVKGWGHVPWRSVAVASLALGGLVTFGAGWLRVATDDLWRPHATVAASVAPQPVASPHATSAPAPVPAPAQALAKPYPSDFVETPETTRAQDYDPPPLDSPPAGDGRTTHVAANPSAPKSDNAAVTVDPSALDRLDPDSRPPPQMPTPGGEMPRLLIKPAFPPPTPTPASAPSR